MAFNFETFGTTKEKPKVAGKFDFESFGETPVATPVKQVKQRGAFGKVAEFLAPTLTRTLTKDIAGGEHVTGRELLGSALEIGSFALPFGAVARGVGIGARALGLAPKIASKFAVPVAQKAAVTATQGLGRRVAQTAAEGALATGLYSAGGAIGRGEEFGEVVKETALGSLGGLAFGAALPVAGAGIRKAFGAIKEPPDVAAKIMQRVARVSKGNQMKFEKISKGESIGKYLENRGFYGQEGTGSRVEKIIEQTHNQFTAAKSAADEALASLPGEYRHLPVRTMLEELLQRESRISSPGAISQDLRTVSQLANKYEARGLNMSETNAVKRLFERNIKLDFLKGNLPEKVAYANNLDHAVRKWQFKMAERLGLKNLPAINRETQLAKFLVDTLGKEYAGAAGNNAVTLTDWIMLSGGDPSAIAGYVAKKGLLSKASLSTVARAFGKKTVGKPSAIFGVTEPPPLQLPSPSYIPQGPISPPKGTPPQLLQAERGPVGFDPKTGRFIRTYKSTPLLQGEAQMPQGQELLLNRPQKTPYSTITTASKKSKAQFTSPKDAGGALKTPPAQAFGAFAGVERDEEGKVGFSPEKAALGLAGGFALQKGMQKGAFIKKLFTTPEKTKDRGIRLLTKSFGDKESAISHADQYWAKEGKAGVFHHATKESSPFGLFEKDKAANMDIGLRRGVSNVNGLYVGRDPKVLHEFYNMAAERGENIVTYKGTPKLLDLTDEDAMMKFTNKFKTGDQIEKELNRGGYDGIKYFDPYATGEEIVITNQNVLEPVAFNGKPIRSSGASNIGKTPPAKAFEGFKDLTTKFLEYAKGKTTLSKQEVIDFAKRPELKQADAKSILKALEEFESSTMTSGTLPKVTGSLTKEANDALYNKISSTVERLGGKIEKILIAGSGATGKLTPKSDFDVIINLKKPLSVGNDTRMIESLLEDELNIGIVGEAGRIEVLSIGDPHPNYPVREINLPSLKIPAQEFADSIRRDLLELKPIKVQSPSFRNTTIDAQRGSDNVALYDRNYRTEIARGVSPEEAARRATTKTPKIKTNKNYEEVVFESPITTNGSSHYPNSKNYFAHARGDEVTESGNKIWREQEIQSDLLQKGGVNVHNLQRQAYEGVMPADDLAKYRQAYENNKNIAVSSPNTPEVDRIKVRNARDTIDSLEKKYFKEIENKLSPFENNRYGERIMRERIKAKAQAGYEKYRLPTGETIGKIEGFEAHNWRPTINGKWEDRLLEQSDLKIGAEVMNGDRNLSSDRWIVTDILGGGRFKAVPKQKFEEWRTISAGEINEISVEQAAKELNRSGNTESFDLTGKSNPQYRRYSDWGKFLKNKFGGKEITDPQGNTWMEIDLKKEMGRLPIEAFGVVPAYAFGKKKEER